MENSPDRDKALELYEAYRKARDDWRGYDEQVLTHTNHGEAMRCAKTGIILLQSDEVVCDDQTGEYWLRSAIGLKARDVDDYGAYEEAAE